MLEPFPGIILKTASWHGRKWYQRKLYEYIHLYFSTLEASLGYSSSL